MNEDIRETFHSEEYDQYYNSLDEKIKVKYDYVESIIKQYKSEIEIARQIMNKYKEEDKDNDEV